ncbi:FecR family protein [bacterium A37T11]|nr:FecR family protein [bacterium A37T11]
MNEETNYRQEAARIFRHFREGNPNEEELAKLQSWYNYRVGIDNGYDGMPESLDQMDRYMAKMLRKSRVKPVYKSPWLYAAASVLLVGMLYFVWPMLLRQEISVTVGAGEKKSVRLPDGSMVVLNAGSILQYPKNFTNNRTANLNGEGYFIVGKSISSPFIVKTPLQEIAVLGTEFNVKAFPADSVERISLVTGRVLVKANTDSFHLRPGQQEIYTQGKARISFIKPGASTAWKDGFFDFFHKPAEEVLQELSRWYGFELVHAEAIPNKELVGRMPKTLKLTTVLFMLRDAGIHFRMEGDKRMIIL